MPTDEQIIDALEKLKAYGFALLGRDLLEYRIQADFLEEHGSVEVAEWFRGPQPDLALLMFHSRRSVAKFVETVGDTITKELAKMGPTMLRMSEIFSHVNRISTPSPPSLP